MSFFSKESKPEYFKQYLDYTESDVRNLELEQLHEAGQKIPLVLFGNIIIGFIAFFIIWNDLPKILLAGGIILFVISIILRVILLFNYQKATHETLQQWQNYFILVSFFSGVVWGVGGLFIEIYSPDIYHGFIAFILGGMAAGAIATNSFIRWNYPVFMVPMLSPLSFFYLYQNDVYHLLMTTMIVAFMLIMWSASETFRKLQFEKLTMLQVAKESLNKLQDSEQRLKDITTSMGEGVFVIDNKGVLTFINPEGERMLGWTFEELTEDKKDMGFKIHVDEQDNLIKRVLKFGETSYSSNNAQFKRKDGTSFPVSSTAAPMHSEDGGVVVVFQDITKQKELEKKLERLALHDALTGLYNRGYFDETLKDELTRAQRYNRNVSLLMLDADFFKKINDTYGHQTGDEVLKRIANIISNSIRNSDYAARYGGEEFAVILPETDLGRAIELAERIRVSVAQTKFKISENDTIQLTISIGVGSSSREISADILIKSADSALYKAKENGRNRVEYIG